MNKPELTEEQIKEGVAILVGIYKVAGKMRAAQKRYFRDKARSDLAEAKRLEERLDKGIEKYRELIGDDPFG